MELLIIFLRYGSVQLGITLSVVWPAEVSLHSPAAEMCSAVMPKKKQCCWKGRSCGAWALPSFQYLLPTLGLPLPPILFLAFWSLLPSLTSQLLGRSSAAESLMLVSHSLHFQQWNVSRSSTAEMVACIELSEPYPFSPAADALLCSSAADSS